MYQQPTYRRGEGLVLSHQILFALVAVSLEVSPCSICSRSQVKFPGFLHMLLLMELSGELRLDRRKRAFAFTATTKASSILPTQRASCCKNVTGDLRLPGRNKEHNYNSNHPLPPPRQLSPFEPCCLVQYSH